MKGKPCGLDRALGWFERGIYRIGRRRSGSRNGMAAVAESRAVVQRLLDSLFSMLFLRLQGCLPLNPQATSREHARPGVQHGRQFRSNTNWQSYGGETTLSYLSQMLGLTVQNFVSAATGMAVLVALIRGLARRSRHDDRQLLVRSGALDALHPVAAFGRVGVVLVSQGVIQNFKAVRDGRSVQPTTARRQSR